MITIVPLAINHPAGQGTIILVATITIREAIEVTNNRIRLVRRIIARDHLLQIRTVLVAEVTVEVAMTIAEAILHVPVVVELTEAGQALDLQVDMTEEVQALVPAEVLTTVIILPAQEAQADLQAAAHVVAEGSKK